MFASCDIVAIMGRSYGLQVDVSTILGRSHFRKISIFSVSRKCQQISGLRENGGRSSS